LQRVGHRRAITPRAKPRSAIWKLNVEGEQVRILVTGATGALGRWVLDELTSEGGHEVVAVWHRTPPTMQHPLVRWMKSDLSSPDLLVAASGLPVDGVAHLASMVSSACDRDPYGALNVNVAGTASVLQASVQLGARRCVILSSKAVYGNSVPDGEPIDETWPAKPNDFYGRTKLAAELWTEAFCEHNALPNARFRLSSTFGPGKMTSAGGQHTYNIFGQMIEAARDGREFTIRKGGDQLGDFIFYGDVAVAIRLALENTGPLAGPYHISIGRPLRLRDLADAVAAEFEGFKATIGPGLDYAGLGPGRYGVLSSAKANKDFGFLARDLRSAIHAYLGGSR
jgi:nucleoside-diphosphate-sugar epimerase